MSAAKEAEVAAATTTSWVPPTADSEFVFSDIATLPAWCDPGWQSNGNYGPALAVPAFVFAEEGTQMDRSQAYHTNIANPGDTVKWIQAEHRFVIERPAPDPEAMAAAAKSPVEWVNPYEGVVDPNAPTVPQPAAGISALQNPPPVEDVDLEDEDDDEDNDAKGSKKAAKGGKKK